MLEELVLDGTVERVDVIVQVLDDMQLDVMLEGLEFVSTVHNTSID